MKPLKYFLIQTAIDWIEKSGLTPFVYVRLPENQTSLPERHSEANSNYVSLNVSAQAIRNLEINEHSISFDCKIMGNSFRSVTAIKDVHAVFPREVKKDQAFLTFDLETGALTDVQSDAWLAESEAESKPSNKPALSLVH